MLEEAWTLLSCLVDTSPEVRVDLWVPCALAMNHAEKAFYAKQVYAFLTQRRPR